MTPEERDLCKAPKGRLRIVHVDPRDDAHTAQVDCGNRREAETFLSRLPLAQRDEMEVYDDTGTKVQI